MSLLFSTNEYIGVYSSHKEAADASSDPVLIDLGINQVAAAETALSNNTAIESLWGVFKNRLFNTFFFFHF